MNYRQMHEAVQRAIEAFHAENPTQCVEAIDVKWQPINNLGERKLIIEELSFNIVGRPLFNG
jgi:hypothetical protein